MNRSTNNLPVIFNYEGKQVRSVKIDGEVWLVAKDVCEVLEIADYHQATEGLDDDEKRVGYNIPTPGGMQNMSVINEAGLYKLTFRSRKPKAKEFTRWVTHEVLPEIMHTGKYVLPTVMEEKPKPAPVPSDIKIYLSKANFSAQEKIIDRGIEAYYLVKNNDPNADKECQKVLALDTAFAKRTGYSALEAAGIKIEIDEKGTSERYWNWMRVTWEAHFKVYLDYKLKIPEPRVEEQVFDD